LAPQRKRVLLGQPDVCQEKLKVKVPAEEASLLGTSRGQKWLPDEERARRRKMRADSISDGGIAMAESRWSNLLSSRPSEDTIRLTKEVLKATNKRGFLQSVQASDTTDVLEFASRITAPTLLVVGSEDRVNPPAISRSIHAAIPGSRLVELDGVGAPA
jgi:pimeloyl-ACP methyl ester carboxylesterase